MSFAAAILATLVGGQTTSRYALARNGTRAAASFTLMDYTFNISTAGILPATLKYLNTTIWFSNMNLTAIPSTIKADDHLPGGLSLNYSMNQQGFSVDVTCEFQNITNIEPLSSVKTIGTVYLEVGEARELHRELFLVGLNIICVCVGTSTPSSARACVVGYAQLHIFTRTFADLSIGALGMQWELPADYQHNYLLMITCKPSENYTVCNLSPKITRVNVNYSDPQSDSGMISTSTTVGNTVLDLDGPAGLSAVTTIADMLSLSQGLLSNIMVDDIISAYTLAPPGFLTEDPSEAVLQLMEEYIRGVAEYGSSVFRVCLSGKNGTFINGVPANMTIPTTGTIYTQTIGWMHLTGTSAWVLLSCSVSFNVTREWLIPGTLVALITIVVVIVAVAQHQSAGAPPSHPFDPGDTMQLMVAAAAGGLDNLFTGVRKMSRK
ncbi:hypothetical protein B0H17DRAFT_1128147 [Mycena rosella]|uniref:Uncharacterized protein n=1 Tax=Mycena rosella TaxID=1033263 RepID=A0AAD7DX88_MYCRO|nr:hypothetical protein B0H17DRAFT_1128147 [Mycena rosella]